MNKSWLYISFKNLINKPLTTFLSIILVVLGVCIISLLIQIDKQFDDQLKKNAKGIDMVIGAKGSPMQLILSAIYHVDAPTGNIDYDEVQQIVKNPYVEYSVPLSYGDSYKGFRILGSEPIILKHYSAKIEKGNAITNSMEVLLGYNVAEQLQLTLSDTFLSSHGLKNEGESHNQPYKVVGVLQATNSVIDNLIISDLESVWKVHDQEDTLNRQITAMLVKFRSPMGMMMLPRMINAKPMLQVAVPAIEISRLNKLIGFSVITLNWIGIAIIITSGLSIFVALYSNMRERKYEVALLRILGFGRLKLFLMVITESLIIVMVGFILGICVSRLGMLFVNSLMDESIHLTLNMKILLEEIWILEYLLLLGIVASVIPAIKAIRVDISKTLSDA